MDKREYNPFDEWRKFMRSKEEKERDRKKIEALGEHEKVLMDELRRMDERWRKESAIVRPDYDKVFSPTLGQEKKEYDKTTLEEFEKKAHKKYGSKYDDAIERVKESYKDKYMSTHDDVSDIYNNERDELKELGERYARKKKDVAHKNAERGIAKSSINDMMMDSLDDDKANEAEHVREDANARATKKLKGLDDLNHKRDREIEELDKKRAFDIGREIDRLTEKQKKDNDAVTEYNNAIDRKERDYQLKRQNTIDLINERDARNERAEKYFEKNVGYRPAKAEEYRERVNMAFNLYNQIPRDAAIDAIIANKELKKLLGEKYYNMLLAHQRTREPV